jgi:hypothetical protein
MSTGYENKSVGEQGKEKFDSAKQTAKDETRSAKHEMGGDKSLTEQAKETYRDNMPESLGGRPPTVAEQGKEKFDTAKQRVEDETRSAKHEMGGDKSLSEQAKETYRDNMPESLGGRPPTVTEQGKEKFDSAKQRTEDELRSGKQRVEDETRTVGGGKSLLDKGKEAYKDNMPETLGGRPPTLTEQGKQSTDEALGHKSLLQKGKEMFRDNMPQFLGGRPPTASEELKDTVDSRQPEVDNASRSKESLSGQMEDLSIDNRPQDGSIKGKSLTEQAKTIYRENMPEALGGRPATLAEKGQQRVHDEARSAGEVGHEVAFQGKAKLDNASESESR